MVAPVPAQFRKLRPCLPAAALRYSSRPTPSIPSNSFACYHIPATPAVSCNYALFAQRRAGIPRILNALRTLSIATGCTPSRGSILVRAPCLGASVASPLVSYSCGLFVLLKKVKSFVINQIQPLFAKHPGWGWVHNSALLLSTTSSLFYPLQLQILQLARPSRFFPPSPCLRPASNSALPTTHYPLSSLIPRLPWSKPVPVYQSESPCFAPAGWRFPGGNPRRTARAIVRARC